MPTKVQELSIPHILKGRDVMVQSETGSGKTLSFAVPTIELVKPEAKVQVLVMTPTRELAKQVGKVYIKFSKQEDLNTAIVYGGVSIDRQKHAVRNADIVVGTPGRLLDLLQRKLLNLTYVKHLVLDEADRMLDMGFIDDINKIISYTPEKKQMLMFSATINSDIMRLMERFLDNPKKLMLENVIKRGILDKIYYNIDSKDKLDFLIYLLNRLKRKLVLVFCNTKRQTSFVAKILKRKGITAECLNGDMSQKAREKVMKLFALKKVRVLVATDVAARGIHVEDISHVINYDLPRSAETYTHRIGRTARNGKKGTAIIFLSGRDFVSMDKIKKKYKSIEKKELPEDFTPRKREKKKHGKRKRRLPRRQRMGGPRRKRH